MFPNLAQRRSNRVQIGANLGHPRCSAVCALVRHSRDGSRAHVKAVSDRLGHASAKTMSDVYSYVREPVEADATWKVENTMFRESRGR